MARALRPMLLGIVAFAFALAGAQAQSIDEKAAVCAACHGESGLPQDPATPVIWGQHEGYLYIELRDFKRGNRKNDQMSAVVEGLERDDLHALAAYFAGKPWPNLSQPRAGANDTLHAQQVASSAQCPQCHLGNYVGDSAIPRLAGQSHDYLLKTMEQFRSGERANNDWMTALLQKYSPDDLAALAKFLAGL